MRGNHRNSQQPCPANLHRFKRSAKSVRTPSAATRPKQKHSPGAGKRPKNGKCKRKQQEQHAQRLVRGQARRYVLARTNTRAATRETQVEAQKHQRQHRKRQCAIVGIPCLQIALKTPCQHKEGNAATQRPTEPAMPGLSTEARRRPRNKINATPHRPSRQKSGRQTRRPRANRPALPRKESRQTKS